MGGHYWRSWRAGEPIPSNAVRGGTDIDRAVIYVGRAFTNGDHLPAKVIPNKRCAYVSFNGKEITITNCEVLCEQKFQWVNASNGQVPHGAVSVGCTSGGETLYVARANHHGSTCVGKLHASHGCCYIPFGGQEHSHRQYEVLVLRD